MLVSEWSRRGLRRTSRWCKGQGRRRSPGCRSHRSPSRVRQGRPSGARRRRMQSGILPREHRAIIHQQPLTDEIGHEVPNLPEFSSHFGKSEIQSPLPAAGKQDPPPSAPSTGRSSRRWSSPEPLPVGMAFSHRENGSSTRGVPSFQPHQVGSAASSTASRTPQAAFHRDVDVEAHLFFCT